MVHRKPPSATRIGVGTVALAVGRELRHLRMALGTTGDFAPCAARVFRPLRREFCALRGATGGAAPWTPAIF